MNVLLLGVNGDIGNSIFHEIYNEKDNFYISYSKSKPILKKKKYSIYKI